ncbi:hypothetical protein B0J11DRAFT_431989 [Dendryphion nanum]|uniref:BTB domain-containing protein n=1 Tax=Dendryphion nanum TaxID=256645 RepID=A0A9P9E141_9PLEO|nr:hypothetical protein B0J11DRAFT_431989 [Dendryphion nanum]
MAEVVDPMLVINSGDMILEFSQEEAGQQFAYRVDSGVLKENSRYFEHLLSDRFSEGQKLSAALDNLKLVGHSNTAEAPIEALPRISIVNVGRISKVSTIQKLAGDFLRILHNQDLPSHPPLANLSNLAVVADRFDALPYFSKYVHRKRILQTLDAKSRNRPITSLSEERVRQKLLVGLFFEFPAWVIRYSKYLIMKSSVQWKLDDEEDDAAALWWDMPNGVEDEMIQRREYILETINSLQAHFLRLYSSGERQCKLGYDTSAQCDSFQLGEMVRFLSKIKTIRMQGLIYDASEPTHYSGDIDRLIDSLRQTSSYQIDRNHAHCGLRVRIIPLLDLIQSHISLETGSPDVGICADCWNHNRRLYAWSFVKRPVSWVQSKALNAGRSLASPMPNANRGHQRTPSSCLARHVVVRDMFMAVERDWTASDIY